MTTARRQVTFDFREHPQLLDMLRILAARQNTTQKAIVMEALAAYFSHRQESRNLLLAAEKTFAEWENDEDQLGGPDRWAHKEEGE